MHIEIENNIVESNNFPNKNNSKARWFTVAQDALLFRTNEKYPDKFNINLYFQSHEEMNEGLEAQKSIVPLKSGKYVLDDKAFYINNRGQLTIDSSRLVIAS